MRTVKKNRAISLALVLVLALSIFIVGMTPFAEQPSGDDNAQAFAVSPQAVNGIITDPAFYAYMLGELGETDGYEILSTDVDDISDINVSGLGIKSLEGIQYFTALQRLRCYDNQLTTLDLSYNTNLQFLECYGNQLPSLDVSTNTKLQLLHARANKLTTIDVSKNTELTSLDITANQLTLLNVSKNTKLQNLLCDVNNLTSLDLSYNTELMHLLCSVNNLTSLNVSKNTKLEQLYCMDNQLTALDVSKNVALRDVALSYNKLKSIDISNNTALEDLYISNNELTSLDVTGLNLLTRLDVRYNNMRRESDVKGFTWTWDSEVTSTVPNYVFRPQNGDGESWSSIEDIIEGAQPGSTVVVDLSITGSPVIPVSVLQAARVNDVILVIYLPGGLIIFIDPALITDAARAIDLRIEAELLDAAKNISNAVIPAGSIVINPAASGQFGFTISSTVPQDWLEALGLSADTLKMFYITSAGEVTEVDYFTKNADGSITVHLSHASIYTLSSSAPTPGRRLDNVPKTGDDVVISTSEAAMQIIALISLGTAGFVAYRKKQASK